MSITYQVEVSEYKTEWILNGKLHREDGPAIERANGDKVYYINGKKHREGGPAVERANGDKLYIINGKTHREDGPAIEWTDGDKWYFVNGKRLSEQEFNSRNSTKELSIKDIEALLGYSVKIVK